MNLYKKNILKHGLEWKKHKYLYKDANGNYVYPEDISRGIKKKVQKISPKTYKKDREFVKESGNSINGINKEEDQIASAHIGSFIKKKNPDTGKSYIEDRREHDSNVAKALRAAKDYSKQINREHENEEASRKVNKKEKLRDIRARKVSKGIEDRFKESELARDFDNKVKKRKKKKVLQHSNTYRSNVMNSHQRMIYSSQLQHAERRNHKYLYIDANGRYIYPEDVPKGTTGIQQHHAQVLSDRRQAKKDKKYSKETKGINDRIDSQLGVSGASRMIRGTQQMTNAHQRSTAYGGLDSYAYRQNADKDTVNEFAKKRNLKKAINNADSQRKSAHAGYEADKKAFPEGGSTEELEAQKKKTYMRKQLAASRAAENERKKSGFVEDGSTEELERQKIKTKARKTTTRTEAGVEAGRNRKKPKMSKEYQEELAYNSKKNVYPEKVLKENVITENIITEKDSLPEKKKKKKPTVKGSKKILNWDNAKIKRWR